MISTTTQWIEGTSVDRYCGIVSAEVILGAHAGRDMVANWRDFWGGRASGYEKVMADARRTAIKRMEAEAVERGANAVVGVSLTYTVLGETNGMLMACATGTAVLVARPK
ncbi:uncharacterized protein YbjQ (UPF0145 family) [Inhella inkyongensis]|uniref:UPF0145 protein HNQ51_002464 n=1 Tax=Inhella inkyongensis TaxID=392593 RepID=A0A840S453_9BURK|nr:YbjQ family protein [Inhella inkyongensis]MBB5205145.1 uncharacterized protein YbjQ (UPF0145 family) [Inhella inkyongensis]